MDLLLKMKNILNFIIIILLKIYFVFFFLILFFLKIVFLQPEYLSHYDNYNMADPKVTPSHLVPE